MTALTLNCPHCAGRGWIRIADWPVECDECTPTKVVKRKVVLDAQKVSAILKRRRDDNVTPLRSGFIPEPPFVDDAPERVYDYD